MRLPVRLAVACRLSCVIPRGTRPSAGSGALAVPDPRSARRSRGSEAYGPAARPRPLPSRWASRAKSTASATSAIRSEHFIARGHRRRERRRAGPTTRPTTSVPGRRCRPRAQARRRVLDRDAGHEVIHPVAGQDMGRFYKYRGRGRRPVRRGRTATVRVTHACTDIPMGLVSEDVRADSDPARPQAPPGRRCDPPRAKRRATSSTPATASYALGADTDV